MIIDSKTLPSMAVFADFKSNFEAHVKLEVARALLSPVLSLPRLHDAHYAWRDDMLRLEERETKLTEGPDHFKQCANLAYWLRRMSPIVEYHDLAALVEGTDDLYPDEIERREILSKYGTEFLAFDFGFKICQYYELEKIVTPKTSAPKLSKDYIIDVCHMMKFKHVSPHSMFLIYRSLFIS
jgi:hypothetical protein